MLGLGGWETWGYRVAARFLYHLSKEDDRFIQNSCSTQHSRSVAVCCCVVGCGVGVFKGIL